MTSREEIKTEIKNIIAAIAPDEDLSGLTDEGILREQINLDSMDFLDIVMELRKRHQINVPEADYGRLATLGSTADYLLPYFQQRAGNA